MEKEAIKRMKKLGLNELIADFKNGLIYKSDSYGVSLLNEDEIKLLKEKNRKT